MDADSNQENTDCAPSMTPTKRHGNPRIARYDEYYDLRTSSHRLRKTSKMRKTKSYRKGSIIIVRRLINSKGIHYGTEVDIRSEGLLRVLQEINHDVDDLELSCDPPKADTNLFFHSYPRLKDRLDEEERRIPPDIVLIEDLRTALEFTEEEHSGTFANLRGLVSCGEITFDLLWALISPNTPVYHYHEVTEQAEILLARSLSVEREDGQVVASIVCDFIHDDGNTFGLARTVVKINEFRGARKIQNLSLFPLEHHKEREEIGEHAISRGRVSANLKNPGYYEISGAAMREDDRGRQFKFMAYGRVMIDAAAFHYFDPNCYFNRKVHTRLHRENLTEEHYMICSPILLGFCFGSKQWGGFAIDRMRDINWSDEAYRSLVLEPAHKKLVLSLVRQQSDRAKELDDIVQGKGKGLVGLLSGNPGCGKTLTAEAVAEVLKQPLYTVSAGELGTSPEDVDTRLSLILERAQRWNAVLLLDEAEVFLQKRDIADITRNALVSIFLRQLEYYQGILILTTNLISHLDPAFESRLHFCIHYPDLKFESRKSIWKMFFNKAMCNASDEDINRFANLVLNGRQIKNAVISAKSIAMEEEEEMTVKHVDDVLKVARSWEAAKANL
ncbi:hypothetical protein A7U60_g1316 [Sanghuangporus baumii]|uniref:AAA+ ATPase domain-containing protein n=1 Tax=Sanghuangporus baumii TaxID=108892 RepID=A0A9Q5I4C4_SANBA|nr:hypothetical protein A7U60_g1316 [Sanghuangporus baumii]